ncbi:MAG: hypothetical protein KF752_05455 [Pirellulaceae bacterium]|nr:hypothetical protein [Pirellulaceae bacterium]
MTRYLQQDCWLTWYCLDATQTVTSLIQTCIDGWSAKTGLQAERKPALAPGVDQPGLIVWTVWTESEVAAICSNIAQTRSNNRTSILMVYWAVNSPQQLGCLIEAGAQLVVADLAQLPPALNVILGGVPRRNQCRYELTAGILERLPWNEPAR